ncbi:MAG TPA: RagB/SusD family nutrient uptake outer membrane protein, partial [Gemmatimonadaceae bacterium]
GSDGFPIPGAWLPTTTSLTATEFAKLAKSYRARFRANVARTPAERAAVNWDLVITDAQGGLTADHNNITSTTAGPTRNWRNQYETFGLWHQMPPAIIGMADTSGAYAAWIATPIANRGNGNVSLTIVTPDLRFPQGATRAAQQADFAKTSCQTAATVCKRYFENRPALNDQNSGSGFGWSNYDFVRFHSWKIAGDAGQGQNGATLFFAKAEVDLLQAEGLYRKGNYAGAAALVNITRVKNGLPAITAFDATTPVPGGSACVPRVPNGSVTQCGNLMEAIKWEKRIETAYVAFTPWYFDSRGWGDLAEGTALFFAVPYQDLQARGTAPSALYGVGPGAGNAPNSAAGKSTYGW